MKATITQLATGWYIAHIWWRGKHAVGSGETFVGALRSACRDIEVIHGLTSDRNLTTI